MFIFNKWARDFQYFVQIVLLAGLMTITGLSIFTIPNAKAEHTIAVLPVQVTVKISSAVIEDFVISALQEQGHKAIGSKELQKRVAPAPDLSKCISDLCMGEVAGKVGATEAVSTRVLAEGALALITIRRISTGGTVMKHQNRSVPNKPSTLLNEIQSLVAQIYDAPLTPVVKAVNPREEEPNFLKGKTYRIGLNIISSAMNDNISGTPVAGRVDETSYGYNIDVSFPSRDKLALGLFYKEEYISLRMLKFVSRGIDSEFSSGVEYAESLEALGVLYGQRYYLKSNLKGFGLGWYAGGAMISTRGYNFQGNTVIGLYEEELLAPLAAFELIYKLSIAGIYFEPSVLLAINTDSEGMGFEVLPSILAGYEF